MPLKLNVGLSKKIGLPNYGSLGASCHVELELEQTLLYNDPEIWWKRVEQTFECCREAIEAQLTREPVQADAVADLSVRRCSESVSGRCVRGNGGHRGGTSAAATARQVHAIESIALRQRLNLLELLESRFGKYQLNSLSRSEASRLIEELSSAESPIGDAP
jgi:hypothetical protein